MYGNAETIKRINTKIAGSLILPDLPDSVEDIQKKEKSEKKEV